MMSYSIKDKQRECKQILKQARKVGLKIKYVQVR